MTNFFPDDVKEASDKIGNEFIKAVEFEGEGLVLQVRKPMEKIVSFNPKYGAKADNFLVRNEVLEEGETFRYVFTDPKGIERKIDTNSAPLFIAFKQVEELGVGDWVKIARTGQTTETRYEVSKVEAPVEPTQPARSAKPTKPEEDEPRPEDIPF